MRDPSTPEPRSDTSNSDGMIAAREWARWHYGHHGIADEVMAAYRNPVSTLQRLAEDQGDYTSLAADKLAAVLQTPDANKERPMTFEDTPQDSDQPDDLDYRAWTIIANVGHNRGGWDAQDPEWVAAAIRWRDDWHATLPSSAARG